MRAPRVRKPVSSTKRLSSRDRLVDGFGRGSSVESKVRVQPDGHLTPEHGPALRAEEFFAHLRSRAGRRSPRMIRSHSRHVWVFASLRSSAEPRARVITFSHGVR
jgi:hypothetical protein